MLGICTFFSTLLSFTSKYSTAGGERSKTPPGFSTDSYLRRLGSIDRSDACFVFTDAAMLFVAVFVALTWIGIFLLRRTVHPGCIGTSVPIKWSVML